MTDRLHDDEISVDVDLVRRLVNRLQPAWAALPLHRLGASGSSNVLFRLGDDLLVRLPRQPGGTATIEKEASWLPELAPSLPVPVPEIVAMGEPDLGYPERWSVVRWLEGSPPPAVADQLAGPISRQDLVADLAAVVTALRQIDVPTAALSDPALKWYRGEPLATMDEPTQRGIEACRDIPDLDLDLQAVQAVWEHSMALPGVDQACAPRWYHGDLFAENLLQHRGRLTGVLDFGGLGVGDPTVDLLPAWEVLDSTGRNVFRRAVGADENTWLRGRAWALSLAVLAFPYYWRTMPQRCAGRLVMVRAVLADAAIG